MKDIDNPSLLRQIAVVLEPRIFLKNDYIIYKNDIGEEMYFIVKGNFYMILFFNKIFNYLLGSVLVLSSNEQKVITQLK